MQVSCLKSKPNMLTGAKGDTPDAGNKTDFSRGNLSPNLQARFCKLYLADLSVAIV